MLFCSLPFLAFFLLVFVAYWAMPARWLRLGVGLSAFAFLGTQHSHITTYLGTCVQSFGWESLSVLSWPCWLIGIIALSTVIASRIGPDRARVWLLLLASFCFYASWNGQLALIICITTGADYLVAREMDRSGSPRWRCALLGFSLVMNLALLAYFKYVNFFLQSVEQALEAIGASAQMPMLSVILPIGISFYTFEAINYAVDIYRRKLPAERNLANFMLFITFFPHLIAGPIVRARDFLPQIRHRKRWDWLRLHMGLQYCLLGLFKKMAIADRMALMADPVFADPSRYSTTAVWLATFAYAFQVYCDFSGYSDMALGTAHMLGYKLTKNFDMPYLSANIAEFWRRWHMSLSTWLRDYLFFPLGGSRGTTWQTNRNLIVTMTLCGLWHGASWPFVVFGFIQGCFLIVHRHFRLWSESYPRLHSWLRSGPGVTLCVAVTFICFCVSLDIFRARTLADGGVILHRLFVPQQGMGEPVHAINFVLAAVALIIGHAFAQRQAWQRLLACLPSPVRGLGYASLLSVTLVLAPEADKAFIYFQF